MSYADSILLEFDQEMASTRKVLERIPDDKLGWKAHPKSNTIGWNANHVADIPNWLVLALTRSSLDVAPPGQLQLLPLGVRELARPVDILDPQCQLRVRALSAR